ncbi:MAG TPA: hypothetical protein DDY32_20420, partial [Desulfobulbaceae bacterium]|nr:hypothetical protein [Desulfobulbaceae bacterium]
MQLQQFGPGIAKQLTEGLVGVSQPPFFVGEPKIRRYCFHLRSCLVISSSCDRFARQPLHFSGTGRYQHILSLSSKSIKSQTPGPPFIRPYPLRRSRFETGTNIALFPTNSEKGTILMPEYEIIDTTLREGEQTPGVLFSLPEKQRILDGLVKVGVAEVELGIASRFHPCTGPLIAYGRRTHPGLRLSLWSRCREEDIAWAADQKPDLLSLSIPVSDIHLEKRLQKDRDWALRTMCEAIASAKRQGLTVAIGFEDATRADLRFVNVMAKAAEEQGVVRVRLADTVGIASPGGITRLVESLRAEVRCPLAVHTHNDFGMATANG